jgi:hypothetical protein
VSAYCAFGSARARRRSVDVAKCSTRSLRFIICLRPAANGRPCRNPRRISLFSFGIGTAHWSASTRPFMSQCAKPRDAKQAPQRQSLTPRAPKRLKKRGSSLDPQGFDAGKKVTGRKRHILVDMLGLLFGVSILPADIQDRDGAPDLLRRVRRRLPFIERKFADTTQRKLQRRSQPQAAGRSRSSNAPISTASSFCRSDGSSSGHSHGSAGMPSRA